MARRSKLFTAQPSPKPFTPPRPPSGELINVILEYADIQQPLGGGHVALRLSRRRMSDAVIREQLGREARRLKDVSLVWDEDAAQVVRVCDEAQVEPADVFDEDGEFDRFELTEAAMAYIAAFEKRRRA
jgi:hypothetical protein